jgi:UDP-N-acetyl-D-glucosamine dehydrogenase
VVLTLKEALLARIGERRAVVGVIGLGYVGLPLALRFSEAGFRVLGFDTDAAKVAALGAGRSYPRRFPDGAVRAARDSGFDVSSGKANREGHEGADSTGRCLQQPVAEA